MNKFNYYFADVFTDTPFGGNQLAVFPNASDIPERYFQKIAREINYSETTFVLPPDSEKADFKLRIFTPYTELPMAGHPTIGTAFILKNIGSITKNHIIIQEGVGNIPVEYKDDLIWMEQLSPEFKNQFYDFDFLSRLLSISSEDIFQETIPQEVSCGLSVFLVRLKTIDSIRKAKLDLNLYERFLNMTKASNIMIFSTETVQVDSVAHSRFFAPNLGIMEDPATGGATGPLASYLVENNLAQPDVELKFEQGFEMGRPSILWGKIQRKENSILTVKIGGKSILTAEGHFYIYN